MEINERAKKILGDCSIKILKDEKEILKKLEAISRCEGNSKENETLLNQIEKYLKEKEKIIQQNEDMEFLKKIAKSLREQSVRITDNSTPPMFMIKNSLGENMFFITRDSLNEFTKVNEQFKGQIIEISESNNYELAHLLDIIKRNF